MSETILTPPPHTPPTVFTRAQLETAAGKCLHTAEALADRTQLENRFGHGVRRSWRIRPRLTHRT